MEAKKCGERWRVPRLDARIVLGGGPGQNCSRDPSPKLGITAAGSRFAHARKSPSLRSHCRAYFNAGTVHRAGHRRVFARLLIEHGENGFVTGFEGINLFAHDQGVL